MFEKNLQTDFCHCCFGLVFVDQDILELIAILLPPEHWIKSMQYYA